MQTFFRLSTNSNVKLKGNKMFYGFCYMEMWNILVSLEQI